MARLNTSMSAVDEDSDVMPATPNKANADVDEEDDGNDMSAIINVASGKKSEPAASMITPKSRGSLGRIVETLTGSLSKPKDRGSEKPEKSIETNAGQGDSNVQIADNNGEEVVKKLVPRPSVGKSGLQRPTVIYQDLSKLRKSRGIEDVYDLDTIENEKETVNGRKRKRGDGIDNHGGIGDKVQPLNTKRGRGRPRKRVPPLIIRKSKSKAEEEVGEEESEPAGEDPVVEPAEPARRRGRPSKDQTVNSKQSITVPAAVFATRSLRSSDKKQAEEHVRAASVDLGDSGVDDILASPSPQKSIQPSTPKPGASSGNKIVASEMNDLRDEEEAAAAAEGEGQEVDENEEDGGSEDEESEEDEVEGVNIIRPKQGVSDSATDPTATATRPDAENEPITNTIIESMEKLMRRVGANMRSKSLSKQRKPKLESKVGRRLSHRTKLTITAHRDTIQKRDPDKEEDLEFLKQAHDNIEMCLKAIEDDVKKIVGSKLYEDKMHSTRYRIICDIYAHSIPDLVGLISVSFESYKDHDEKLTTPALSEIIRILDILYDLCMIAREQPKILQPKQKDCQLADPTRQLFPIVRRILGDCNREVEKRAEALRKAASASERARSRSEVESSRSQSMQASAPASRRFSRPSIQQTESKPLSRIQRAARSEQEALKAATVAKDAARVARLSARQAEEDPFDIPLQEKAESDARHARIALEAAIKAENRKVELVGALNLIPAPSQLGGLIGKTYTTISNTRLTPRLSQTQRLGDRNLRVKPPPEWEPEELLIMAQGLEQIEGEDKYLLIADNLPSKNFDEIVARARLFKEHQLEFFNEQRRINPKYPDLPQWVHEI